MNIGLSIDYDLSTEAQVFADTIDHYFEILDYAPLPAPYKVYKDISTEDYRAPKSILHSRIDLDSFFSEANRYLSRVENLLELEVDQLSDVR